MKGYNVIRTSTLLICLVVSLCESHAQSEAAYHTFWQHVDSVFLNPEISPLEPVDIARFDSVARFPYRRSFAVKARWQPITAAKPQDVETTTSAKRRMQKVGILVFELQNQEVNLPVYKDISLARMKNEDVSYFLPFTDLSNGEETYGGGRYLDLEPLGKETAEIVLDFNLAYNPYCVYSARYSCPIPPIENHVPLPITAGARMPAKGKP